MFQNYKSTADVTVLFIVGDRLVRIKRKKQDQCLALNSKLIQIKRCKELILLIHHLHCLQRGYLNR